MECFEIDNSYGLAKLQENLLDIMKFIHLFCEENNIVYSLSGGSLLGAIRHNGFIPWDDDFDIMFDRKNYEKFLAVMQSESPEGYILEPDQWVYRVRKEHRASGYVPSIDLFVLDEVPEKKVCNKIQILLLRILQGMLRTNEKKNHQSLFYRFCISATSKMGKLFRTEKLFRLYDKVSQWGDSCKDAKKKLSIFDDRFHLLPLQYSWDLMEKVELHAFADTQLYIISEYEQYLTCQFGNYMELPPEEDRAPSHLFS